MSIVIKKLKNIYGIKLLNCPIEFDKNNFIYAPNGTMKTSFSDGLYKILNNQNIEPEFDNDGLPEFKINIDGIDYSTNNIPTDKVKSLTFKNEFDLSLMPSKNLLYIISDKIQNLLKESKSLSELIYEKIDVLFNDSPLKTLKKNERDIFIHSNIAINQIMDIPKLTLKLAINLNPLIIHFVGR